MTNRLVRCSKYGKELPGLERAPYKGELGELIFQQVSAQAWKAWKEDMQIKVVNEYRLNMGDKKDYEFLLQQMRAFLCLTQDTPVEVENADRGRRGMES